MRKCASLFREIEIQKSKISDLEIKDADKSRKIAELEEIVRNARENASQIPFSIASPAGSYIKKDDE